MKKINEIILKEGDEKEWLYKTKCGIRFKCKISRNPYLKHLCGYVFLNKDNLYYGKDYDEIPVSVHGGLSYSDKEKDNWVIGFDCSHHNDFIPGLNYINVSNKIYRDMKYVKNECEQLCEQLSEKSISILRLKKISSLI